MAARLFEQAVQLEPGQAEIRLHAAIVYLADGKSDHANVELKERRYVLPVPPAQPSRLSCPSCHGYNSSVQQQ